MELPKSLQVFLFKLLQAVCIHSLHKSQHTELRFLPTVF